MKTGYDLTTKTARDNLRKASPGRRQPFATPIQSYPRCYLTWSPATGSWALYTNLKGEGRKQYDLGQCDETYLVALSAATNTLARNHVSPDGTVKDKLTIMAALKRAETYVRDAGFVQKADQYLKTLRYLDAGHKLCTPEAAVFASSPFAHVQERRMLVTFRAKLRQKKDGTMRSNRTVDRIMTDILACARIAISQCNVAGNMDAWTFGKAGKNGGVGKLSDQDPDRRRDWVRLTDEQIAVIIAHANGAAPFFRACAVTGARNTNLKKARVCDLVDDELELSYRKGDGAVKPFKCWAADPVFTEAAQGKQLQELLFTHPETGEMWTAKSWGNYWLGALERARKARPDLNIPKCRVYDLRHNRISAMINKARLPVLAVAQQCGTSVREIERTYWHPDRAEWAKLYKELPSF